MDLISGISAQDLMIGLMASVLFLTTALGVCTLYTMRALRKIKINMRHLTERVESIERYNGLNQTNTDIRMLRID